MKIKPIAILLLLILSVVANAQTEQKREVETTFEVIIHVVGGSNNGRSDVPSELSAAIKRPKSMFGLKEFRLEAVFLERTSGSVDHRGQSLIGPPGQKLTVANFNDWSIRNIRHTGEERLPIMIDGFRFGARVMYPAASDKPDAPRFSSEWYGISNTRVRVSEDEPALVGTFALENGSDVILIFLTVRRVV